MWVYAVSVALLAVVWVVRGKYDGFFSGVKAEDFASFGEHFEALLSRLAVAHGEILLQYWHYVATAVPSIGGEGSIPERVFIRKCNSLERSVRLTDLVV